MAQRVLRLPANSVGRDYVVGDIHGAYDLVLRALQAVQFSELDRLFCVGDLIDRGADSGRVEQFLQQPNVYAVRGNHDNQVARCETDMILPLAILNFNGMRWLKDLPTARVRRIQRTLDALPYAIEIGAADGGLPTGIVHAQVPQNWAWPDLLEALELWPVEDELFRDLMTCRLKFDCGDTSLVSGVKRVFVGHSICWDGPKVLGNTVYVDTGAVHEGREKGASLSIIDLVATDQEIEGCGLSEEYPGLRICRSRLSTYDADQIGYGEHAVRQRFRSGLRP